MKNYKPYQLILILTPFVFSFAFGLDIYIPIVPEMIQIFDTSPQMVQLTMSLFLFTTGVGQLLVGPLSDQLGRKKVLYASSACFALGGLFCAYSGHIVLLILARIIASIGACGMLVTAFAVVRDLYSGSKGAKMYSFLNGAIGISPTFAPFLGGHLAYYFNWQSIFLFLTCLGILALIITKVFIKETHQASKRVPMDHEVLQRYMQIFTNRQFLVYSAFAGLAESVFFCFFSTSPIIIINLHGIPAHEFGYYFAVFGAVIGLGGFASGKIVEIIGPEATIGLGIFLMIFGGIIMIAWYLIGGSTLEAFLIPMVVACTGAMFLVGASAARALEPFGEIAGTASAAFGSVDLGVSAIAGSILMLFPVRSTIPYGCSIVVMGVLSLLLFRYSRNRVISLAKPFPKKVEG